MAFDQLRINWDDDIKSPLYKRFFNYNRLQWHFFSFHFTKKYLARNTLYDHCIWIFKYGWMVITHSHDSMCCSCRWKFSSTNSFMKFIRTFWDFFESIHLKNIPSKFLRKFISITSTYWFSFIYNSLLSFGDVFWDLVIF